MFVEMKKAESDTENFYKKWHAVNQLLYAVLTRIFTYVTLCHVIRDGHAERAADRIALRQGEKRSIRSDIRKSETLAVLPGGAEASAAPGVASTPLAPMRFATGTRFFRSSYFGATPLQLEEEGSRPEAVCDRRRVHVSRSLPSERE